MPNGGISLLNILKFGVNDLLLDSVFLLDDGLAWAGNLLVLSILGIIFDVAGAFLGSLLCPLLTLCPFMGFAHLLLILAMLAAYPPCQKPRSGFIQ